MLWATGRRPPSMSEGGMWSECGSDGRDGGRESRPREHGEGGSEGLQGGGRVSLEKARLHVWLFSWATIGSSSRNRKVFSLHSGF